MVSSVRGDSSSIVGQFHFHGYRIYIINTVLPQHICHADAGQLAAANPSQGGERENFYPLVAPKAGGVLVNYFPLVQRVTKGTGQ